MSFNWKLSLKNFLDFILVQNYLVEKLFQDVLNQFWKYSFIIDNCKAFDYWLDSWQKSQLHNNTKKEFGLLGTTAKEKKQSNPMNKNLKLILVFISEVLNDKINTDCIIKNPKRFLSKVWGLIASKLNHMIKHS